MPRYAAIPFPKSSEFERLVTLTQALEIIDASRFQKKAKKKLRRNRNALLIGVIHRNYGCNLPRYRQCLCILSYCGYCGIIRHRISYRNRQSLIRHTASQPHKPAGGRFEKASSAGCFLREIKRKSIGNGYGVLSSRRKSRGLLPVTFLKIREK